MGCPTLSTKGIGDIGGYGETDVIQRMNIIPRTAFGKSIDNGPQHPCTAIAGGTTTKSYDDLSAAPLNGIYKKLSRAIAGSNHRITLLGREQRQAAGLGHLNHSHVILYQILRFYRAHQRVEHVDFNQRATHGTPESLQPSLAAIADRNLHKLSFRQAFPDGLRSCLIGLHGRQTPLEGVDGNDNPSCHSERLFFSFG